ncbi:hypothetical protein PhCBS80983_g03378 [Powellomyces hirtus]|uniref:Histone deacetylase domain-containing protein n=1 Tax=Powellomyces hirtus TaxID=109895 RepID=A0A507E4L8_9FUNG|nr:hypothetical protein PhCBS80983_g03378 [Powellomyces hirtus]
MPSPFFTSPVHEFELGKFVAFKEVPARVTTILDQIRLSKLGDVVPARDFGTAPIDRVHSLAYRTYLKHAYKDWCDRGGNPEGVFPDVFPVRVAGNLRRWGKGDDSSDTAQKFSYTADGGLGGSAGYYCFDMTGVITDGTYEAAYAAAQVALTGAELLVQEKQHAVFSLCRPPGHHAHSDICGGYCFFNNAAIATRYLSEKLKVGKVAIIDIDYHHGNGTQDIFYSESNPLYVSLHAALDYPYYWGSEVEVGENEGEGFNVNVPLKLGTRDEEYVAALKEVLDTRVAPYNPDCVVVSLGVDTFVNDPIGAFFLTTPVYTEIGRLLGSLQRPTLFVMEGGYAIPDIGVNVTNVLHGFESRFPAQS